MEEGRVSGDTLAVGGGGIICKWLEEHSDLYYRATRHPFILSIRDGTVNTSFFKRWLTQDYIFVREFVLFTANLLLKASNESDDKSDIDALLGGLASLNDEVLWFKREASKWEISLFNVAPLKANQDYCRFLQSLMLPETGYTTIIVAFWGIETVYQKCFSLCLEEGSNTPPELLETCQRWGNAEFGQYCYSLQKIATRCLERAPKDAVRKAEEAFLNVLEHEVNFWNMSTADS